MLRISPIEYEILNLLRSGEKYGLELVKSSSIIKRGTVYVYLERMTEKGYVRSRTVENANEPGLPRRLYSLEGLGQRVLHAQEMADAVFAEGANG